MMKYFQPGSMFIRLLCQGIPRIVTHVIIARPAGPWQSSQHNERLWIAASAAPPDGTTGETTSHLTRLSNNDSQVIGYSHSTKPASGPVAGYRNDGTSELFG